MSQSVSSTEDNETPHGMQSTAGSQLVRVVGVVVVVLVFSVVSAHAPSRIKLLGLFHVVAGFGLGATIAWLFGDDRQRSSYVWRLAVAVMTFLALGASSWIAFRNDLVQTKTKDSAENAMARNLIEQVKQANGLANQANDAAAKPTVVSGLSEFDRFLIRRVGQLGDWKSPWPELFWLVELILGGIAAAIGFSWGLGQKRIATVGERNVS